MLQIRKGYYYNDSIPIAALTLNRYKGKDGNVYVVTDTYFTDKVKGKDYTKYEFNGQTLAKNRLVQSIIKDYVARYPEITFNELEKVFPQSLQGRETFTTEEIAKNKRDRRNFIKPEELIKLKDSVIAVSTQWGKGNVDRFVKYAKDKLKYNINVKK